MRCSRASRSLSQLPTIAVIFTSAQIPIPTLELLYGTGYGQALAGMAPHCLLPGTADVCWHCQDSGLGSLCYHRSTSRLAQLCMFDVRSPGAMVQRNSTHHRSIGPSMCTARDHYIFTSHAGNPLCVWDRRYGLSLT